MPTPRSVSVHGGTIVREFDGWMECTLPDGKKVTAVAHTGPEDVARAHALGYGGDLWAMTREHDLLHAKLAAMLGLPESPVLRSAVSDAWDGELIGAEEAAVLAIQRFWNLARGTT